MYKSITINSKQAHQIAILLNSNEWNRPGIPYTAEELLKDPNGYFLYTNEEKVLGTAQLKKISWYLWELGRLAVHPHHRRKGIARSLVNAAEEYVVKNKGALMQATVEPDNIASQNLLKTSGWFYTSTFIHPYYKTPMQVLNKTINQ